jgi:tRNA A37 threonylcarbamoyladenosine dehydratase
MSELEFDFERRFGALSRLYGVVGAKAIFKAHVVVVGIGGVGSWVCEALARSGVAKLTLIDMDHLAESNVNRQIHALTNTIGKAKGEAMKERIALINPNCEVVLIDDFVTPENWPEMAQSLDLPVDALIDACDQVKAKVSLVSWALLNPCHFVSVGAAGGKRLAHEVQMEDLLSVTHDPLLSQLRYRLRRQGTLAKTLKKSRIQCVFSKEPVLNPWARSGVSNLDPGQAESLDSSDQFSSGLSCHGYGSSVSVTATFGMSAAGWVMDQLAKQPQTRP